jgi:hypothetical protein
MPDVLPRFVELVTAVVGFSASVVGLLAARQSSALGQTNPAVQSTRSFRRVRISLLVSLLTFVVLISLAIYAWESDTFFAWALKAHDPIIFAKSSKDGDYDIARLFLNRAQLSDDGNYPAMISGTTKTFNLLAIGASSTVGDNLQIMGKTLEAKPVAIKILIFDPTSSDCDSVAVSIGRSCEVMKSAYTLAVSAFKRFSLDLHLAPGATFEIKQYTRMPLYTMWVRDAYEKDSVGHVEVLQYRGGDHSDQFSFTFAHEGGELAKQLAKEFQAVWENSKNVDLSK